MTQIGPIVALAVLLAIVGAAYGLVQVLPTPGDDRLTAVCQERFGDGWLADGATSPIHDDLYIELDHDGLANVSTDHYHIECTTGAWFGPSRWVVAPEWEVLAG